MQRYELSFVIPTFLADVALSKSILRPTTVAKEVVTTDKTFCKWEFADPCEYDLKVIQTTLQTVLRALGAKEINSAFTAVAVRDVRKERHSLAVSHQPIFKVLQSWSDWSPVSTDPLLA